MSLLAALTTITNFIINPRTVYNYQIYKTTRTQTMTEIFTKNAIYYETNKNKLTYFYTDREIDIQTNIVLQSTKIKVFTIKTFLYLQETSIVTEYTSSITETTSTFSTVLINDVYITVTISYETTTTTSDETSTDSSDEISTETFIETLPSIP